MQDPAVRQAVAMGIDKERFAGELLDGNGEAASGPFPAGFALGGDAVSAKAYDPVGAARVLEAAGWVDRDGDGIREKDGRRLTVRWLTYPAGRELPLLAEAAQYTLGEIGFEVIVNATADHNSIRTDPSAWDVYASAMVTAPTGDPAYFFAAHCLDGAVANNGHYHSDALEALAAELSVTFDTARRAQLAARMQQIILDDDAFVFCAHLRMTMVCRSDVTGLTAHPCDFYEITGRTAARKIVRQPEGKEMQRGADTDLSIRGDMLQRPAVTHDVSFSLHAGEILAIAGESGSGKSSLLRAAMGLLGRDGLVTRGDIWFQGLDLPDLTERKLRQLRGAEIGMIFQDAGASFCPIRTVGAQTRYLRVDHPRRSQSAGAAAVRQARSAGRGADLGQLSLCAVRRHGAAGGDRRRHADDSRLCCWRTSRPVRSIS